MKITRISTLAVLGIVSASAFSQSIRDYVTAGGTYSENFNSLVSVSSPPWSNNPSFPVIVGWSSWQTRSQGLSGLRDATPNGTTAYAAGNGSSNIGALFSFGTDLDRSLGFLNTNTTGDHVFVLALKNTTGATLNEFNLGYEMEQWRDGNTVAQSLIFDYKVLTSASIGFTDTDANGPGFTVPGGSFDGTSPLFNNANAVNGNTAGLVTGLGGTITGLSWAPGAVLLLRWWDDNHSGNDHAFGLDTLTFSASTSVKTIGGVITLLSTAGTGVSETIGWTLSDNTNSYNGTVLITDANGAYTINLPAGLASGTYSLKFKGGTFLSKTLTVNYTGSSLTSQDVSLVNGDIDQDTEVGPGDFEAVIAQFGAAGSADVDNDDEVGPSDFETVVANFGLGDE